MQFTVTLLAALSAATAFAANTVQFVNQDSTNRTITFTPNSGLAAIPSVVIPGNTNVTVTFPYAWIGNYFSVSQGAAFKPGMLGEVNFNSWGGLTYFDVSAIVDPSDTVGVQWLYPAAAKTPTSGCNTWLCDNVYINPDDVQTKTTLETDLVCLIGVPAHSSARRHARQFARAVARAIAPTEESAFPRRFITGEEAT